MTTRTALDPVAFVRPELRQLGVYHLDLTPCRHKLDQNEVPWDLPRRLKDEMLDHLRATDWARYPDFHADALRQDLARLHNWPWEGVLVGNGSNELLGVTLTALVSPGTEVLSLEPTFGLYRPFVLKAGGIPRFLFSPLPKGERREAMENGAMAGAVGLRGGWRRPDGGGDGEDRGHGLGRLYKTDGIGSFGDTGSTDVGASPGFSTDPGEALLSEVSRNPHRPLLLCCPNNPTGAAFSPDAIEALLDRLEAPLLLDNAYGEFCRWDYRPLLARHRHLILFRTFSKAWSLAGMRLGYLLADPALVAELIKVKLPYNLSHAAIFAGRAVLAAEDEARRRVAVIVARRAQWERMLAEEGLQVFPSEANFLLVRCGTAADARRIREGLERRSIRVRDVGGYPGLAGCLRVSVGNGAALRATRKALRDIREEGA